MNTPNPPTALGLLLDISPDCPQNCCTLSQLMVKQLQHRFGEQCVQDSCAGERVEDGLVCGDLCRIRLAPPDRDNQQLIETVLHLTETLQQQFDLHPQHFSVRLAGQASPA
ncbi:hypothetical protein [Aestuariirhabdus litorea]|uniref:Uncharacterized protein n=1 Tax=Aestuariirhabdus litorea TaxID=2528527 RepID=A0A3P3VQV2_9GAMM|nr:hypothetical protein [Aestuariirhabdus litorea]RRJ85172.1 hypothetical protein D0544_08935 [Aestuariirhabdus litorea]RWW98394.1 hypothetical protein DZC74_08925 [Endozoicomonadaceae bacterium GTF-13]